VLIDDEGRARVADFGIARGESSDITATGSVMGTAQYLSPEQAQGKETTPRSDIYSIGVILYEALTGRVPFEGESAVAVALKQVSETPRRPSAINPNVPPALDAVVMRALAKDPEARFKDADAFLKALDAAERAPDRPRPEDTAAFAAVSPEGEHAELHEPEYADSEEEDGRRRRRWIILVLLVAAVAGLVAWALTRPAPIVVPNVISQEVGTATKLLEDKGFDVDITPRPSAAPRDTVTEQDPIPGSKVDEGSKVTLTVSSGPAPVKIPDVQGLSEPDATKRLSDAGLLVDPEFGFSDVVPEGRAIGTEPSAGITVQGGQTVKLIVSRGSNNVEVPLVLGLDDQVALSRLTDAELTGNIVQQEDEAPAGEVVGQSPVAGKLVARGSQVTVFVSSGAITVPDVIGDIRRAAVTELKRAGFAVAVNEEPTPDPAQDGRVTNQFPPAGSRGQRGDTVTVSVGVVEAPPAP
jgi:beta-lactam-binding protein with PASTA domain